METKEVIVNAKKFVVHELLAVESDKIADLESTKRAVELVKMSSNLSDNDYAVLTVKERGAILKAINELNGWSEDFQKPQADAVKY